MKTLNDIKKDVISFIDGYIQEAIAVQADEPTLGDITPVLCDIRDEMSTIKSVKEFKDIAQKEKLDSDILYRIYRATSNEYGLGDTDYSDSISKGIIEAILD